jgi:seryl-tRNA synthetase
VISCPGHSWDGTQSSFTGPALDLYRRLDAMFARLAERIGAEDHTFPTMISAKTLAKMKYFTSFPHTVTFAVALDSDEQNLDRFRKDADRDAADGKGIILTDMQPVQQVLTPAACYHFYPLFAGRTLSAPTYLTTRTSCHRRETHYVPLRRQWCFGMREIVCIGTAAEAKAFVERAKREVAIMLKAVGCEATPTVATDPFFRPERNPLAIMQKLDPVKTEFVFGGDLAVASVNLHHDHFGGTFGIARDGKPAHTACLAFGVERWIHMMCAVHGSDPANWIVPEALETHPVREREPVLA